MTKVYPLPNRVKRKASELSPWQSGFNKPEIDGLYLREFDEGDGVSEFHNGEWRRDGFFLSDIQDARWRGLRSKPTATDTKE